MLVGLAVWFVVRAATVRQWRTSTQLVLFARANGFTAEPYADVQPVPGIAGRTSSRAWTRQLLRWDVDGRPAHLATYHHGYNSGSTDLRYFAVKIGGDLPGMSFRCGHDGPQLPESRFGPEVAVPSGSLHLGGLEDDTRARGLFDDELVGLLADPKHPTNAEVVEGWFIGYVNRLGRLRADGWRHVFAVADLVVRRAGSLS